MQSRARWMIIAHAEYIAVRFAQVFTHVIIEFVVHGLSLVRAENVIRIDLTTESHDHRGNDRAAIPRSQSGDLTAQADMPA
jgi:hypothetical protein